MQISTNAEQFASRGDEWGAMREETPRRWWRNRKASEGGGREVIEPEPALASGPRAAIHKPEFVEPNPPRAANAQALAQARRACNQLRRVAHAGR